MAGTAIATVGMWLLSTMTPTTGRATVTGYMIVVGVGIGLVMQVVIMATQNAVDRRDLGIATGTVSFFRLLKEQPLRATVADGSPADVV